MSYYPLYSARIWVVESVCYCTGEETEGSSTYRIRPPNPGKRQGDSQQHKLKVSGTGRVTRSVRSKQSTYPVLVWIVALHLVKRAAQACILLISQLHFCHGGILLTATPHFISIAGSI